MALYTFLRVCIYATSSSLAPFSSEEPASIPPHLSHKSTRRSLRTISSAAGSSSCLLKIPCSQSISFSHLPPIIYHPSMHPSFLILGLVFTIARSLGTRIHINFLPLRPPPSRITTTITKPTKPIAGYIHIHLFSVLRSTLNLSTGLGRYYVASGFNIQSHERQYTTHPTVSF